MGYINTEKVAAQKAPTMERQRQSLSILLITFDSLHVGGVRNVFMNLAIDLNDKGHRVTVRKGIALAHWRHSDQLPVASLKRWHGVPTPVSVAKATLSVFALLWTLVQVRPDVVNVHCIYCNQITWLMLKLHSVFHYKIVLSGHGSDIFCANDRTRRRLPQFLEQADAVTAVTHVMAQNMCDHSRLDPGHVQVIPNGVNYDFWSAVERHEAEPYNSPKLISVGRLHEVKGYDLLLTAFARIRQVYPGATLEIIGQGPMRSALENQIEQLDLGDAVSLPGLMKPSQIRDRLSQASLFVMPSRSEGMPLALLEAMAVGIPVVASRVGGVPDVVGARGGWLVEPEDIEGLAGTLTGALSDVARAEGFARSGKRIAQQFCSSQSFNRYEQLFYDVCKKSPQLVCIPPGKSQQIECDPPSANLGA